MTVHQAKQALSYLCDPVQAEKKRIFFKNSQNDIFLGIKAPFIRKIAKEFFTLSLDELQQLMRSDVHEERSLANEILCERFRKAKEKEKTEIFHFYIQNKQCIRDWNGVDDSAPYIVGAYLLERDKQLLYQLALSEVLWDRRIAIVATWWFIRHKQLEDTFKIAELLLGDREDLIHKATGWMLREAGKRDETILKQFLEQHHTLMPRTMLRYAIEKFPAAERQKYLIKLVKNIYV
jgi:3-methyladenine DNA glycosylase AlkD